MFGITLSGWTAGWAALVLLSLFVFLGLMRNLNTYDEGTITFEGSPTQGTYLQFNIYDVDYDGEYSVRGTTLVLTGDESWKADILDADHITGTWQHEEGQSGTFEAVRSD